MALQGEAKRRAYGQHFLIDGRVIDSIVGAVTQEIARVQPKAVLEIGPGRGAITEPFLAALKEVSPAPAFQVCEMDRAFAEHWSKHVPVLVGDFLDHPPSVWLPADRQPLVVFSNLPYASGTAILTRLAEHPDKIPAMVLMFQAEVAQRFYAQPSTKAWGSLAVWTQNRWDASLLCKVPPRAFKPAPKVDSEVVVFHARQTPRIAGSLEHPKQWQSLITAAFRQRRKMLRGLFPAETPERKALDRAHLDGTKRAEALSWDEWQRWFAELLALTPRS